MKPEHYREHDLRPDSVSMKIFRNLDSLDCIVAGGYCLSKVQRLYGNLASEYNDIDVFVLTQESYNEVHKVLSKLGVLDYDTILAASFTVQEIGQMRQSVQLIKPFRDVSSYDELIEDFDLDNSKYWTYAPWNKIYTKQANTRLHVVTPNKKVKWNYHFLERMLKYQNEKKLQLDFDQYPQLLGLIKSTNKERYNMGPTEYNPKDQTKYHLDNVLLEMIKEVLKTRNQISKKIDKETQMGKAGYMHLQRIMERSHDMLSLSSVSIFLFDYWAQEECHTAKGNDLVVALGAKLSSKKYYLANLGRVKRTYPELLL